MFNMPRKIPFTAVPHVEGGSDYKFSMASYIVGIIIFVVGTLLGCYILPTALTLFHWATWITALIMWAGFAGYLIAYDPKRLRAFLAAYFSGLGMVLLIATIFGGNIMIDGGGMLIRPLKILPIIGAFISIVKTYLIGSIPDIVITRW
jgi:peptidoglycan/LPS O-acetylase OafA/YrhL